MVYINPSFDFKSAHIQNDQNYYKSGMILTINSEKLAIGQHIALMDRLWGKMGKLVANRREMGQFKLVLELIEKHMLALDAVEGMALRKGEGDRLMPYVQANLRIKNHIARKIQKVRELMRDVVMLPYAVCAVQSLTEIRGNLDSIESKMVDFNRTMGRIEMEIPCESMMLPL